MLLHDMLYKIRKNAKLSQEEFANLFKVSRQAVQKWESGNSTPEISKLVEISKYFGISLDALILNRGKRTVEEITYGKELRPECAELDSWESYAGYILDEYRQSSSEGLDIGIYKNLFEDVAKLPRGEIRKDFADILFKAVINAKTADGYKYTEPSTLAEIKALRKPSALSGKVDKASLRSKIEGAWYGRICGCMLGKSVESVRSNEFIPFLKETGNYPLHRYIYRSDLNDDICSKYNFAFANKIFADEIDGMPADDDTNYIVLGQELIERCGRNFTPLNVSRIWLDCQPKNAYCTAERVAYCNFIRGYNPPQSAMFKNPYREWIGAQIRGDYYGYINPGNPEAAAEMAWRDASISHVKNGIYGEMFASAMIAAAAVTDNMEEIVAEGLAQIPSTSRLFESVSKVVEKYKNGETMEDILQYVRGKYDEHTEYGWCHTIPNAMIVAASLLFGGGDYAKTICTAVQACFDTDCNGATVGSVVGMAKGISAISDYWRKPIKNTLHTGIFGLETVDIDKRIDLTMEHIENKK